MVRLTIPALHVFRDLVVSTVLTAVEAEGGRLDADARDEIVSALGEAFNNVVLHAYRDVLGGTVDVRVTATPCSVEIVISDRGRSFDPGAVPAYVAPELDDDGSLDDLGILSLREGGMGLFIMRSCMDEVTYVAGGNGRPNVLVLRKSWPASGSRRSSAPPHMWSAPHGEDDSVTIADHEAASSALGERGRAAKKESSQSGWRMRSVAVPSHEQRTAGSLRRK
ncbi:MAG: ATP-binding protein [Polyangiaceae bacterium]